MNKWRLLAGILVVLGIWAWQQFGASLPSAPATPTDVAVDGEVATSLPAFLPPEAHHTLALIRRGGPYPYRQDGGVFHNREGHLPERPDGYYHEYTVTTPGARTRGARRIVTAGQPPVAYYYTGDHYRSFRRFQVTP